jgi:O-antigen/teichoic acid export membrane protein
MESESGDVSLLASHQRVAKNAAYMIVGQVLTLALGILVNALIGRTLGPTEYGLYFLIFSISSLSFAVVEWGQMNYVIAAVARRPAQSGDLIGTALSLRVIGTVIAFGFTAVTMRILGYETRVIILALAMMAATLPQFLTQGCALAYRGYQRMDYDSGVNVVTKLLLAGAVLLAVLTRGKVMAVIIAQGAASTLGLAWSFWIMKRLPMPPLRASRTIARELLAAGTPLVIFGLGVIIQQYIDATVIARMAPVDVVGWYGAARSFGGVLVGPVLVISSALLPRLSMLTVTAPERFLHEAAEAQRPMLLAGVLTSAGTYLFADVAVALVYSKKAYGPAVQVLQATSPIFLLVTVSMFFVTILTIVGRLRAIAVTKIVSIVVGGVGALVLIPLFQRHTGNGGVGAALAGALAEAVMAGVSVALVPRKLVGVTLASYGLRSMAAGAAMIVVGLAVSGWHVLLRFPLALGAFALAGALLGIIRREDLRVVAAMMPAFLRRGDGHRSKVR